jgi:hypothetical protein
MVRYPARFRAKSRATACRGMACGATMSRARVHCATTGRGTMDRETMGRGTRGRATTGREMMDRATTDCATTDCAIRRATVRRARNRPLTLSRQNPAPGAAFQQNAVPDLVRHRSSCANRGEDSWPHSTTSQHRIRAPQPKNSLPPRDPALAPP